MDYHVAQNAGSLANQCVINLAEENIGEFSDSYQHNLWQKESLRK